MTERPPVPKAADIFNNIGMALRLTRQQAGLSLSAVARKAGIGKSQLSKYENGFLPTFQTLARVIDALEADPRFILGTAFYLSLPSEDRGRLDLFLVAPPRTFANKTLVDGFVKVLSAVMELYGFVLGDVQRSSSRSIGTESLRRSSDRG